jgi:PAS domain S-box-containing protein
MTSEPRTHAIREAAFQLELHDASPALLEVSQGVRDLLGYGADELLAGRVHLPSLIHPHDADIAALLFSMPPTPQDGEGVRNLRVRHANGRILCVKGGYRHRLDGGRVLLDLLLQDARTLPRTMAYVSPHLHAAAVLENTEDYVYFKDRNHVFTGASQTLVALCDPAEHWTDLLGQTDYDVFPEEAADDYYRLEKRVFAGEAVAHEIQPVLSRDGQRGWVDNRKYPIRDANGAIIGLHGVARDITAAKGAEDALRASEARARATIDASPVPMAVNDHAMRVTFVNPAFTRTFGYELADIPTLADWWPKAYPDPVYRQWVTDTWARSLAHSARTGAHFEPVELAIRCKDGTERLVMASATPLGPDLSKDHLVVLHDVTASKQAERQLQRTAHMLAEAQRLAHMGSWELMAATHRVTWSEAMFRIFGMEPADSAPPFAVHGTLFVPQSWSQVSAGIERCLTTGQPYELEVESVRVDGTRGWVWLRGERALDPRGEVLGLRGVAIDITERKRAELEVSRSRRALAEAQRISHLGSWELEASSGNLVLSDELCRIYGYEPRAAPRSLSELGPMFSSESRERLRAAIERAIHVGETYEIELDWLRPDGTPGRLWGRGEAVADESGAIVGLRGVAQDVTERRRAEEARRLSDVVFRSISQGVIVAGPDRRILSTNEAFCSITGYSEAELLGRDCELLVGPLTHPSMVAAFRAALANNAPFSGEIENQRRDGTPFWNELTLSPVFDELAVLTHFIGVTRDITSRKLMERKNAEIEAQLQQAQRLETVGTLSAGIAHDFNNILAAIIGNAELAATDIDHAHSAHEPIRDILTASHRAKTLVQQLLAFSSPHPQSRQPLALGPLVREVTAMLRATIPATIQILASVDDDAPSALADASQIHQALVNLCTNAWHALDGRPGLIEVRLATVDIGPLEAIEVGGLPPGRYVALSVRDTGKGMDAATRQRIFEPFFTTKEQGKGTGLGLSVVHGIVAAHQGAIQVLTAPGEGSTFTLYLPAAEPAVAAASSNAPVSESSQGPNGHIAYIDDEEMLVRVATRSLQRLGHHVTGFARAVDAVRALADDPHRFDVIVTDMNMPEVTGLQVAAEVRKLRFDLPIVLVSGNINEDLRRAAAEVGIAAILGKPFKARELSDLIANLPLQARTSRA